MPVRMFLEYVEPEVIRRFPLCEAVNDYLKDFRNPPGFGLDEESIKKKVERAVGDHENHPGRHFFAYNPTDKTLLIHHAGGEDDLSVLMAGVKTSSSVDELVILERKGDEQITLFRGFNNVVGRMEEAMMVISLNGWGAGKSFSGNKYARAPTQCYSRPLTRDVKALHENIKAVLSQGIGYRQ